MVGDLELLPAGRLTVRQVGRRAPSAAFATISKRACVKRVTSAFMSIGNVTQAPKGSQHRSAPFGKRENALVGTSAVSSTRRGHTRLLRLLTQKLQYQPAPKNRRKPSRGRSKEKDSHVACCTSYAVAASAQSRVEGEDYWQVDFKNKEVVRHHCSYRSELFCPNTTDCPMDLRKLGSIAVVVKTFPEAPFNAKESWNWRSNESRKKSTPWVGKTIFKIKDSGRQLRFSDKVRLYETPMDKGIKMTHKPRTYSTCFLNEKTCPKPAKDDLEYAKFRVWR